MGAKEGASKRQIVAAKNLRTNLVPGSGSMLIVNGKTASGAVKYNIYK